jgi:acyl carrier protein
MKNDEIVEKVIDVIAESTGFEKEKISPSSTLFDELSINSIDMVDILYTLEMEYDISLKISDLERDSREEMEGKPFEIDNVITEEGLVVLAKKLPEIPKEKLVPGLTVNEIVKLITVETLARMVHIKIEGKENPA